MLHYNYFPDKFKIFIRTFFVLQDLTESKLALKIRIKIQMCLWYFYISKFQHILPKLMFNNFNSKKNILTLRKCTWRKRIR